ncbi:MAG: DUF423 domain-containing protein [Bacteroidetes bacterium]|nr:DUF423 domain-containing protein [Bacteroidota bacterium]
MNYKYLGAGALFAAFSVMFGAFGAHQLKEIVETNDLVTWETACRYQMVHALALLLISQIGVGNKHIKWAGIYFIIGIFLFSGSLYLIALKDVFSMNLKFIGPLTPIGGLFFIVGWIKVFMFSISNKEKK